MAPKHDVAIYSPGSSVFFGGAGLLANDAGDLRASAKGVPQGGGAEIQMAFLSRGLSATGLATAIITWPSGGGPARDPEEPDLVERPPYSGTGTRAKVQEARHIWRAMREADARAYIFRGGGPQLMIGDAFCRLHRRRLVFSAANDLDFDFNRPDRTRAHLVAYRAALRDADLVVVQRSQQGDLARAAGLSPIELIPSFAEPAEPSSTQPEAFLWIGRLVDYKRPMEYVRLAESLPDARFRMVWHPTNETRPELVTEVRAAHERLPNLEFAGQIPRGEVLGEIDRAYAVVSTSRAEGMPNTFLEAWSRAIPVVSLDFDPDGRIAKEGLGLVAHTADELRDAAARVFSDPAARAEMGERAREYVAAVHSPATVSGHWANALREALAR
jgi:glycosyltransferase involved in cell wall biosynthesis